MPKGFDQFVQDIQQMVQDNAGALQLYMQNQEKRQGPAAMTQVYQSALGRALEDYTAYRPTVDGSLHTVTANGTTVPDGDYYAVCKRAACELCGDLARYFAHNGDGGDLMGAISAHYKQTSDIFARRATELCQQFTDHIMMVTGIPSAPGNLPPEATSYPVMQMGASGEEIRQRLSPYTGEQYVRPICWSPPRWGRQ